MNISTITKLLLSCPGTTTTTPALITLLHKQPLRRFSSLVQHCEHLSKGIRPATPHPRQQLQTCKPVAYHVSSGTSTHHGYRESLVDDKTSALNIWEDLKQMRSAPIPALVLGFSGLTPFVLPPAYMIMTQTFATKLAFAQNAYGACILAFLGGIRWGFVVPERSPLKADWYNFGYSLVPTFVAWTSLMMPHTTATLTIMAGVACTAYFDTAVKGYPPWFKGLRFILSMGTLLSLWSVILCKVTLLPPSKTEQEDQTFAPVVCH